MINSKSSLHGLLAIAVLTAASSGIALPPMPAASRKRQRHDENAAWQKRLAASGLKAEQQAWNANVEAARAAKKVWRK